MGSLGDRLRSVRKRRGLTQRELAAESGLSLSLVRKIEQGEIADTRLETLRKLATALRVSTMTLSAGSQPEPPPTDVLTLWEPVRRALVGQVAEPEEAATVKGVEEALRHLMPVFRANRYSDVLPVLPALIRDANALGEEGREVRTKILNLAGCLLTHTHQYDSADLALDRALDDATDRFEASAVAHNLTWLMIRRGQLDECTRVATEWADELEPRMSKATTREVASWGWMLIRVAMAGIRDNRPGEAADAMRLAQAAALVVGREFQPPGDFLRPYGPLLVMAKQAELAMIEDQPNRVLALSDSIPRSSIVPTSDNWNRHLLDVANAHTRLGRLGDAVTTLQKIRANAPEWLVQQRYARDIVGSMIERRRTLTPEMRALADSVRLTY